MSYPCNSQCKTKSVRLKIPNKVNHESGSQSNRDVENNLGNTMSQMEVSRNRCYMLLWSLSQLSQSHSLLPKSGHQGKISSIRIWNPHPCVDYTIGYSQQFCFHCVPVFVAFWSSPPVTCWRHLHNSATLCFFGNTDPPQFLCEKSETLCTSLILNMLLKYSVICHFGSTVKLWLSIMAKSHLPSGLHFLIPPIHEYSGQTVIEVHCLCRRKLETFSGWFNWI